MNNPKTDINIEDKFNEEKRNPFKEMPREELIDFAVEQVARLFWQQILFEQSRKKKRNLRKEKVIEDPDKSSKNVSLGGGNGR